MRPPWWVEMQASRLVLELRELLVRCDENLAAHALMQQCVPFYLLDGNHPEIEQARADQAAMVAHITNGPKAYRAYYASNEHERPFEDQYGIQATAAHKHIPRVELLRNALTEKRLHRADGSLPVLLDCACNDGWLAANLRGIVDYHGIDLNVECIERAIARNVPRSRFLSGDLHDAERLTEALRPVGGYDHVVAFEVLEHVPDPDATLRALCAVAKPGASLFLSTPAGAVEGGNLPRWWHVEPKGHVRVFTPGTFVALLEQFGEVGVALGPDGVLVAHVKLAVEQPAEEELGTVEGATR